MTITTKTTAVDSKNGAPLKPRLVESTTTRGDEGIQAATNLSIFGGKESPDSIVTRYFKRFINKIRRWPWKIVNKLSDCFGDILFIFLIFLVLSFLYTFSNAISVDVQMAEEEKRREYTNQPFTFQSFMQPRNTSFSKQTPPPSGIEVNDPEIQGAAWKV